MRKKGDCWTLVVVCHRFMLVVPHREINHTEKSLITTNPTTIYELSKELHLKMKRV